MPYRIDIAGPPVDLLDQLIAFGAMDVETGSAGIAALLPDSVDPVQVVRALGPDVRAVVTPAVGRDDDSVWVLHLRPITVGRLTLVPSEFEASAGLRLLDRPAFGTGLHPTTALCIEAIHEDVDTAMPDGMLDVGTGSGVLALAALMLGVASVTAIDTEANAIAAARENARLNQLEARLELRQGSADVVAGTWPLVVANVLAAPLMEMAPALVRRIGRGGRVILSGIPVSVGPEVERTYTRLGMRATGTRVRAGWIALMLRATW